MNNPQPVNKIEAAHADSIWTVAWSGSERLLTGSLDGSVRIWNSRALEMPLCVTAKERVGVNSVTASDDGKYCMACYQDATIRTFAIEESTGLLSESGSGLKNHILDAWTLDISPDNDTYVIGTQKGGVHFASIQSGQRVLSLEVPTKAHVYSTTFNDDGSAVACAAADGSVTILDPVSQKVSHSLNDHQLAVRSVSYSADSKLLYCASEDRHVSVYDTRTSQVVSSFSHSGMCLSVSPSPDGRHFVVGNSDHSVYLWDLGMQKKEQVYHTHTDQVWGVSYDRTDKSGKRFASVGDDALCQLYE